MPPSDDELAWWFHQRGWTLGEVGFVEADGRTNWVVTARRGGDTILGKAHSKEEAWAQAVRQAAEADEATDGEG